MESQNQTSAFAKYSTHDIMNSVDKKFISVVVPCYNEEAILAINLTTIINYLENKSHKYRWEIIIVNDGSKDRTRQIADEFADLRKEIKVIHHPSNLCLGRALQTGFCNSKGDVIVVLDVDLSYSVEYIEEMVDKLYEAVADIVIASPYMKGGKVTAVPFARRILSRWVNRFMRMASQDKYYTFTGMVRAYRRDFIRTLNLKTKDYEINPEIIYKGIILRARMIEIPAHLDWSEQNKFSGQRKSSLRILRSFFSGIMSGFIFRPYMFFIGLGMFLMALSLVELIWLLYDTISYMAIGNSPSSQLISFPESLAVQFKRNPQTFLVGGITFVIAMQFLSVGFLSLQNKRYFEELFHMGTSLKKQIEGIESSQNA